MADVKTVEVNLLGRTYRVACSDEEREALMQAVAYLDGKMNEIRKAGKVMGAERIAVMAALNVAHELLASSLARDSISARRNAACLPSSPSSMRPLPSKRNCSKKESGPCCERPGSYFPNR